MRKPDFNQLVKVLKKEKPDRVTFFEFFLNDDIYESVTKGMNLKTNDNLEEARKIMMTFFKLGYDYFPLRGSEFLFQASEKEKESSFSLNEGFVIKDRDSFEEYNWPDATKFDYSILEKILNEIPDGMKVIIWGPDGVLENVIKLVGYENLCYMLFEDPELVKMIFEKVGTQLEKYYEICASYEVVGALISNDDWGFAQQTMLSTDDMRKYVFPWHKKIVNVIHKSEKLAILHSCGNLNAVMDDIIFDIKYDAKHSFEDKIFPVEDFYEKYVGKIAILGGIDIDFLCRAGKDEIITRVEEIIKRTKNSGGYALGSGNSIAKYVPSENYYTMISTVIGKGEN